MHRPHAVILSIALAALMGVAQPARAESSSRFDLPIQPLADALRAVGDQTNHNIFFDPKLVAGRKAPALRAQMSIDQALGALLRGTGLTYDRADDGTVTIRALRVGEQGTALQLTRADAGTEQLILARTESAAGGEDARNQVTVQGERDKPAPFRDGNADIPRTTNDAQPYYVFDAKAINASGATSIEDFLKQRLTMNTLVQANSEKATTALTIIGLGSSTPVTLMGSTSTVDLRGLGADKTLVLINGRRAPGVKSNLTEDDYQPDLSGIPVSAIDRIEVLPSSASGIYGGGAMGGVVNVILKRDYIGGEMRATYDNSWEGDSPRRTVTASYGMSFEDGRTHLNLGASWSDASSLLLQDRVDVYRDNLNEIMQRRPGFIYSSTTPWLGTLPNIYPTSATGTTLTLRDGTILNTRNTYVPAGISAATPEAVLRAGLIANAGNWNLDFAPTTQPPTGLLRPIGQTPEAKSVRAGVRREMNDWLELFADVSLSKSTSSSIYNPVTVINVPARNDALYPNMANPFRQAVYVLVPDATRRPLDSVSQSRSASLGAQMQLPGGWTGMLDYTWSQSRYEYQYYNQDTQSQLADIRSGALNVFVDNLANPADFMKYATLTAYDGSNRLHDIALRANGPLPSFPWGQPRVTVGLEHRIAVTPANTLTTDYPLSPDRSVRTNYYEREQVTDSAYLEATVPSVETGLAPGLYALDLQLSGRAERFKVGTGTTFEEIRYQLTPPTVSYGGTTQNGLPYFSDTTYSSNNYTVGVKYQPVREVILRVSRATAFLPPSPGQLLKDLVPSAARNRPVLDPTRPTGQQNALVYTLGGGNPGLVPQNSRSFNAGLIWTPESGTLSGLRVNAEYYRIEQFDAIGTLTVQQIVDQEATYPDRVQRESNGDLYLVDTSSLNLFHRETEGMDFSLDYTWRTSRGAFSLRAAESVLLHLKEQLSQTLPEVDSAGFPSEGGAAKYKSNGTLTWEGEHWTGSWMARYVGSYKQYGSAGGPQASQAPGGIGSTTYSSAQGAGSIPSQMYHDLFVGYSFDGAARAGSAGRQLTSGVSLQLGVRNVFDKVPPLDVYYPSNYFLSPYGDLRLRSYWLNVGGTF